MLRAYMTTNLLVDDGTETSLALDDGVRDTHLAAESGQENHQLNGVNIVGDEDQGSLLVLNQADDVVQTVLDGVGLLGNILLLLALLDGGSLLEQTLLLLGLGLRAVLVQKLECLGSGVLVEDVLELRDRRRHLEAHVEDLLLALEADILRPLHHAGDIALGLDVLTDTEVAGTLLDERVLSSRIISNQESVFSRGRGIVGAVPRMFRTYLRSLLAASLGLGEGCGSRLLSGLGRLSLRKKDISKCAFLNSKRETTARHFYHRY